MGVVDNDPYAAKMLGTIIARLCPDARIVWTVTLGVAAVRRCFDETTRPDVLVTDMAMEDIGGVDVSRQIRSRGARPGIVCVTSYSLGEYETAAADAGAQACVAKTDLQSLAAAITAAADGLPYRPSAKGPEDGPGNRGNRTGSGTDLVTDIDTDATNQAGATADSDTHHPVFLSAAEAHERLRLRGQESSAASALSVKEREVLRRYAQGEDTSGIAAALGAHRSTIATYERRACAKLHAKSRAQAIWIAAQKGLL